MTLRCAYERSLALVYCPPENKIYIHIYIYIYTAPPQALLLNYNIYVTTPASSHCHFMAFGELFYFSSMFYVCLTWPCITYMHHLMVIMQLLKTAVEWQYISYHSLQGECWFVEGLSLTLDWCLLSSPLQANCAKSPSNGTSASVHSSSSSSSRKPGAIIESFVNHAPGVFSGTFSGEWGPKPLH